MERSNERFAGRSVIVTGGSAGIGAALVTELRVAGAAVTVLDRRAPEEPVTGVEYVLGDVSSVASNREVVEAATARTGRLDAFVGNAGIHDGGRRLSQLSPEELDVLLGRVLDVNVRGYLLGVAAAQEHLRESGGVVVLTLSDAAFEVSGNGAGVCYAVSKHAGLGIVRSLAADLAPAVRVNAVAPGGVLTSLRAPRNDGQGEVEIFDDPAGLEQQVRSLNPLGSILTPSELVPHYLFLLSEESSGMTGEVLRPDGGLGVS